MHHGEIAVIAVRIKRWGSKDLFFYFFFDACVCVCVCGMEGRGIMDCNHLELKEGCGW